MLPAFGTDAAAVTDETVAAVRAATGAAAEPGADGFIGQWHDAEDGKT